MIDRNTPKKKQLHLIVDNYATHKHPEVLAWLAKHPRLHMHIHPARRLAFMQVENEKAAVEQRIDRILDA